MNQTTQVLTFFLSCPQPRAWLVLTSDDQEPHVVEMQHRKRGVWSASVDLIPGDYRCRYYSGDDRNVSYYGPARMDGGIDCEMDTPVSVRTGQSSVPVLV